MNLWHDVEAGSSDDMNVIIEIPKLSKNKYEIDKETGLIALDRVMHSAQDYPFDYGFVPQTLWDDDDALDVLLLTTYPLATGIVVPTRPVGIMNMVDDGEGDEKSYWPEMWSIDYLNDRKRQAPVSFSFQYQNQIVRTSEMSISPDLIIKIGRAHV